MRNCFFGLLMAVTASLFTNESNAQSEKLSYTKASAFGQTGQIFPTTNIFHRVDTAKYQKLPAIVKHLLTQSAGKAITFKTNSKIISARWCVSSKKQLVNLTPIVQKGLDLYIKRKGKWVFAGVGKPNQNCNEEVIVSDMDTSEKECLLYLPLYDEILSLEIGIEAGGKISSMDSPFNRRILVYGSSITQGASASRPGLAYPARLSRATGIDFLNLGLSGNAKMHREVADMIAEISADGYVLDCVPNSSTQEIKERTAYLVGSIRKNHPHTPIIMIQSIIREQGNWNNKTREFVVAQNQAFQQEYEFLIASGVKSLYFIREDNFLGNDHEGTIDGTHPNDLGFERFLNLIQPQIVEISNNYNLRGKED